MLIRASLLVAAFAGLAVAPTLTRASAAPCTTATTSCERWVTFAGGPARSMVYATFALDKQNKSVTRALIMVHGADRNADHYFETATAAGFLAGALGNTIIIAPRFAAGHDTVSANEVVWPARGDSWRSCCM
jgi:hypothetical protein